MTYSPLHRQGLAEGRRPDGTAVYVPPPSVPSATADTFQVRARRAGQKSRQVYTVVQRHTAGLDVYPRDAWACTIMHRRQKKFVLLFDVSVI